jgi:IS30 family transposase
LTEKKIKKEWIPEKYVVGSKTMVTFVGKNYKGSIVTLVDRKSLYHKMYSVKDRTSESVSKSIKRMIGSMKEKIHKITFDNGKEFAKREDIAFHLNAKILITSRIFRKIGT